MLSKNPEARRAYREKNRELLAAKQRAYYAEHREEIAEYRAKNKELRKVTNQKWYKANAQKQSTYKRKRNTGWQDNQFREALLAQAGLCAICQKPMKRVCADHDHETGKTRDLLCVCCNARLAYFENLTTRAPFEAYLAKWSDA